MRRITKIVLAVAGGMMVASQAMAQSDAQPTTQPSYDELMEEYLLVDVTTLDSTILVDLRYSSTDNFVGEDMYGDLERAYLTPAVAHSVALAQRLLRERYPEYTLLIYDAARPISVQRKMRSLVEGTPLEKYVADGTRGGRHNYGVAVDLTIAYLDGTPLDMGAEFDEFSPASAVKGTPDTCDPSTRQPLVYRTYLDGMVRRGVIREEHARNRMILIEVMSMAGLVPYRNEWWHFEQMRPMSEVRINERLLDF